MKRTTKIISTMFLTVILILAAGCGSGESSPQAEALIPVAVPRAEESSSLTPEVTKSESAVVEPAVAEPAVTGAAASESAVSNSAISEPAVSESAPAVPGQTAEVSTSPTPALQAAESASSVEETGTETSASSSGTEGGQEDIAETIRGIVAIDPGHQGPSVDMSALEPDGPGSMNMKAQATSGTVGTFTGIGEYELNLDISLMLRTELEKRGYEVILTREDNETAISNSERAILANEAGADIYVRIHANGSDNSAVSGALAMSPGYDNPYVGYLAEESEELALDILNSYCEATGMVNQGLSYTNTMTGINWSEIPVMILEMGYMTNESDDNQMANAEFRNLMVKGIADGIDMWYASHPSPSEGQARRTLGGKPFGNDSKKTESTGAATNPYPLSDDLKPLLDQIDSNYLAGPVSSGEVWGVTAVDLTGKTRFSFDGDRRIRSASVIKLFIMAAVYEKLYMGVSEEERMTVHVDEGSCASLLNGMITVSDNDCANSLVEWLGDGDFETGKQWLNAWCMEHGYTGTTMGRRFLAYDFTEDNYTTSDDCALLLASVYDGTCVTPAASEQMLALLKAQTRLNKIPAGVTAYGVQTANKTGELADATLGFVENDAAIVWSPAGDYVLCTLSENLGNNADAISRITKISDMVYRWFNE